MCEYVYFFIYECVCFFICDCVCFLIYPFNNVYMCWNIYKPLVLLWNEYHKESQHKAKKKLFTHAHDLLIWTWKYYVYLFMIDVYLFSLTKHLICGYLLNEVCNESDFYFRFYKKSRLIRFCVFFLDIFSFSLGWFSKIYACMFFVRSFLLLLD